MKKDQKRQNLMFIKTLITFSIITVFILLCQHVWFPQKILRFGNNRERFHNFSLSLKF